MYYDADQRLNPLLMPIYDFFAEHWNHPRRSNLIQSVFATVRHRTVRTKSALS